MRGPIEARIAALRGQVRRLLALHGFSYLVFGLTLAVLAAGLGDWLFHFVPEIRVALLAGVIGLGLTLAVRKVLMPLVVKFADLDIALRIEDRWPGLNDRLASTVQFLRSTGTGDEASQGSQALRDATVEQTLVQVKSIDFRQAADPRSARKAVAWAVLAVALMSSVVAMEPRLSEIAARRLFRPFGPDQWPQMTHLTILDETPTKIARGMPFALFVGIAPGERMPSTAKVTYRYPDGETSSEPLRSTEENTFRGRLESVSRPFSFWVEAGDDVTREIEVAVVPPPVLDKTTIKLTPPAYTGVASTTLASGNTQVRAVEGTRVEFEGIANKAIASALLRRGDVVAREPVTIDQEGKRVTASFDVGPSQPFWIELKDTEGFNGQEVTRFDLRALKDEAPRVVIDEPSHDRDVPPEATIPIQISFDDDYGVQLVRLVYKVASSSSEPSPENVIPLWAPPEPPAGSGPVKHQVVNYRWDLTTLKNLQPGTVISFYAEARDFDNLKGPNIGKSREMRLRIVSKEDVERQLEDQQRAIREEIDRILGIQKQAKTPVDDALRAFKQTDKLPDAVRNDVKNAEIIQRQVNNRLTNRSDGLEQKIRQAQQDANDFKIDNADAARQMAEMREAVDRIKDRNLGPAEQALTQATKQLDQPAAEAAAKPPEAAPGPEAQQPPGLEGKEDKPAGAAEKAQAKAGDQAQAKAQAGDQAKTENQGKAEPGDQAKAQAGNQAKAQAGDQAKAENQGKAEPGDQAKAQAGEPGKAQEGPQAKAQSKAQGKSGKPSESGKPAPEPTPGPAKDQPASKAALAEAEKNQKAIVEELEKMLAGLGRFDNIRTAAKEANALLKQEEQLMKQAAEAAGKPDMAGKPQEALTPENKAALDNLAAKQKELAQGLQDLQGRMEEMAKKLDATDPLAASALREAAQQSRKQATSAKMNEAAEKLEKNQMNDAQVGQAQARRDLKDLVDAIQNRRERELSRLVAELKNAEADLKKLRDKQAANLKKTQAAQANPDPKKRAEELKKLAKEQDQIQDELKKQMQKLAKLNAEAGAQAGAQAGEKMAKAQGNLDQDQGEQAEGEQEEALKDLKQAQEEVANVRKEAEEQLAMEQIAKMTDALKSVAERQDQMSPETSKYDKMKGDNEGKLNHAQTIGVRQLGQVQDGLKDEVTELADKLGAGAPVFQLTLKRAAEAMETSARRLQSLKTDETTIRAQKLASGHFKQLIDSLKPDKAKGGGAGGQGQPPQGGDEGGGGGGGGDGIPASAQIKVLKALQQELNNRTDFFDELLRRQKELDPEQAAELEKLHEDQGVLADLVRDLTKPKKDDGED